MNLGDQPSKELGLAVKANPVTRNLGQLDNSESASTTASKQLYRRLICATSNAKYSNHTTGPNGLLPLKGGVVLYIVNTRLLGSQLTRVLQTVNSCTSNYLVFLGASFTRLIIITKSIGFDYVYLVVVRHYFNFFSTT